MPVKRRVENKPSIKIEMGMSNSKDTGAKASALIQIRISGASPAARNLVAKTIGRAVQTACQKLTEIPIPRSLH